MIKLYIGTTEDYSIANNYSSTHIVIKNFLNMGHIAGIADCGIEKVSI
jgi:hypothetical protein